MILTLCCHSIHVIFAVAINYEIEICLDDEQQNDNLFSDKTVGE